MSLAFKRNVELRDAKSLMPPGRETYNAIMKYVMNPDQRVHACKQSAGRALLDLVIDDHGSMRPPLPEYVVTTISAFNQQYDDYFDGAGYGVLTRKKNDLEETADTLLDVVLEYGYSGVGDLPVSGGTEM